MVGGGFDLFDTLGIGRGEVVSECFKLLPLCWGQATQCWEVGGVTECDQPGDFNLDA